ncbi:hypothetical protein [Mesorhizobium atlanticum]|uniref:hypothetical protein n=1 Tax=Mesorhizobium atlanticum TaxID=2233532 RepID=UPI0011BEC857|nr:hypothetical protein [Mesorhizobium atlanticum]
MKKLLRSMLADMQLNMSRHGFKQWGGVVGDREFQDIFAPKHEGHHNPACRNRQHYFVRRA